RIPLPPSPPLFPYTTLFRSNRLPGDAHRGVHRDRDRDAVGPIGQRRIPRLGRQVETADVVAPIAQTCGRRSHVQRLVPELVAGKDRKSTRLNSSHSQISYAV